MAITAEFKKTATDTGYAVVGVTDLAVQQLRHAQARAAQARTELEQGKFDAEVKRLQARLQHAPTVAMTAGLEAAGKAEETYGDLSARGKKLVERIRKQKATQDLVEQGKATLTRTKAAVTTVRRGAGETQSAAKATATTAQREAGKSATRTKPAAKRTTTTARKRAASSKTAAKGATTTARKTASTAAKATQTGSTKVGS
ncbi:MAG TPA: hypothetical protein VFD41_15295 [Actinomycetales bacterium]|nr:hypothetical protein [Actinomycetales bacterium]